MIKSFLENEIRGALETAYSDADPLHFKVEASEHSDYASNAAMALAGVIKENPREVASRLKEALEKRESFSESVESVEIAGRGFLNFTLGNSLLELGATKLSKQLDEGFPILSECKYNIEFISANPTGKLHIGHGRGAFYGDVLANIFSYGGAQVTREYYINNSRESKQISELGKTAKGDGEQYKTPALEKKIKGHDFSEMSEQEAGVLLSGEVQKENRDFIEHDLKVHFDTWYSEDENLRAAGMVKKMKEFLEQKNLTYEKEGALWLATSKYGDDEDRVIVRSDAKASYFLSDIAYHHDKFTRGLDTVFNIWGADHGGHIKRMQAVKKMLDWQGNFHIFVVQMVSLTGKEGGREKMSKRAGNVILVEDLLGEFGIDVVRWFFLEKALSTQMNFDLDLARDASEKNPVLYVQYAHARLCSILQKAGKAEDASISEQGLETVLKNTQARKLALKLALFPEVLEEITEEYAVNKLTTYTYELAQVFSGFYHAVRVIDENGEVNAEALALVGVTRATLARALVLLGISAPRKM